MSTQHDIYAIYGVKLDHKINHTDEEDERLYDLDLNNSDFSGKQLGTIGLLYDGMSGEYWFCGVCLAFAEVYDGDSVPLTAIDPVSLSKEHASKIDEFMTQNNLGQYLLPEPYQLYIFSHYH